MQKRYIAVLGVLLMVLPLVAATNANIIIKTKNPDHGVIVRIEDPALLDTQSRYAKTNAYGDANVSYTTAQSKLTFQVLLVKNGIVIETRNFPSQPVADVIHLRFYNETPAAPPAQEPIEEETSATNEETLSPLPPTLSESQEVDSNSTVPALAGSAVTDTSSTSGKKYVPYIIGVVLLAGIIGMFFFMRSKRAIFPNESPSQPIKVIKQSEFMQAQAATQAQRAQVDESINAQLRDAEIKLAAAQAELRDVKHKEEMRDAERRLAQAQAELDRLRQN